MLPRIVSIVLFATYSLASQADAQSSVPLPTATSTALASEVQAAARFAAFSRASASEDRQLAPPNAEVPRSYATEGAILGGLLGVGAGLLAYSAVNNDNVDGGGGSAAAAVGLSLMGALVGGVIGLLIGGNLHR